MESYNRIAPDVELGRDVKLHGFVNAYGCKIGDRTRIGTFVEIQKGATIGPRCKVSSHTFICEGVTVGEGCFIGHGVMFTNDRHPRAVNGDGEIETEAGWAERFETTHVGNQERGSMVGRGE